MLIGIAGPIASGKDAVAKILTQLYGFEYHSIRQVIKTELKSQGKAPFRKDMREFANGKRKKFGSKYFVSEAMKSVTDTAEHVVLSEIYCVGEAEYFLKELKGVLIFVDSKYENRLARYKTRLEDQGDHLTDAGFLEASEFENSSVYDSEPNLSAVAELASITISNDGDLIELQNEVRKMMQIHAPEIAESPIPTTPVEYEDDYQNLFKANEFLQRNLVIAKFLIEFFTLGHLTEKQRALAPLVSPEHAVREIGNQLLSTLVETFSICDASESLRKLRDIPIQTTDAEMALLINDEQFGVIHENLHNFLDSEKTKNEIRVSVKENLDCSDRLDRQQFDQSTSNRCLEKMCLEGISIQVYEKHIEDIRSARMKASDGMLPVIEQIKSQRWLEVSDLNNSKVATTVHDAIDHVWLFELLSKKNIFAKYQSLFDSIGDPEHFDIFRREGECVASIGFGVRSWANCQPGFRPKYTVESLLDRFDGYFDNEITSELHLESYRHLRKLVKNIHSRESQCLGFVFSNYLVELDEQRRKHGRIKQRDNKSKTALGELDPWGADYMAFFIEAHRELLSSKNKHRDTLLRVHIRLEEFFNSDAALHGEKLILKVNELYDQDFSQTNLPADRIEWMATNYGFTAMREQVF